MIEDDMADRFAPAARSNLRSLSIPTRSILGRQASTGLKTAGSAVLERDFRPLASPAFHTSVCLLPPSSFSRA